MAASAAKKISNVFIWILMGLLFVALAGFGIGSFNGGASRVGSVGDVEISADDYFRALNNEINAQVAQTRQAVSFNQIQARGIDAQVLAGLTARAALSHEASEMGISVGDAEVARQIGQISAFQNTGGEFDMNSYQFMLQQQGSSPREFEEDTREDVSRALLQAAVVGGLTPPTLIAETLTAFQAETRDFTRLAVVERDLPEPIADPSDADLVAYYEEFPARFTRPEARRITYAWLIPSAIMDDVEIDEDVLLQLYNDRLDEYVQPERRLLERLVFGSDEEVIAALDAIAAGETDFDTLVEERDLSLDDIDMGVIAPDDLSDAAAAIIFGDDTSELLGPVPTPIGPALFRVNAVLEASEVPFEDAREELSAEMAQDGARRAIDDMREEIDDLLASGLTLEELANDTAMTLGTLDYTTASEEGIAAYDGFRDAAAAVQENDFPELLDLSDGGLFALRLDEVVPPTLPPLAEIEGDVADAWQATALRDAVADQASQLVAQIATGARLEDLGETTQEQLIRRQDLLPDLPATTVAQVFQLGEVGDIVMIPGPDAAHIVRLDRINSGTRNGPDTQILVSILSQTLAQSMATDIFEAYGQALQEDAGITLNQSVINAVHASFP